MGHCCNLMKRSTAACFASGVRSALLCVLPSHWVLWKEKCPCSMARMLSEFYPREEWGCCTAPSLFFLFFLHLCRSLRAMQMRATPPHISILRVFSPEWTGCAPGSAKSGKVEWMEMHFASSHQHPTVFSVFLIHNPLKLFNLAAKLLYTTWFWKEDMTNPTSLEAFEESHARVSDF